MAKPKTAPSCTLADLVTGGPIQLTATINGQSTIVGTLMPRSFASGSYGYGLTGKALLPINGNADKFANLQLSCNLTVIGSKPAVAPEAAEEAVA